MSPTAVPGMVWKPDGRYGGKLLLPEDMASEAGNHDSP